jgi:UDP-N-acetylglucosamine--N-acetylmuramyl-(pentapeptide) pyrophosphoryl-undecaprenol N-acetylglucosamine transferase
VTVLRSVVLAGGGTGGHIEPALALAECIRRYHPDARVTCLGTPKGLETEIIPARGWDLELVPAYPLPRKPNADLARTPGRIRRSVNAVAEVLDRVEAEVVVGFGGYVALPAYLAARKKKVPAVVHEVNDPPGIANKVGSRLTPFVGLGGEHVTLRHGTVVGVPLRRTIATLDRVAARASGLIPIVRRCSSRVARRAPARSTSPSRRRRKPSARPASRCCTWWAPATPSTSCRRSPARST